MVDGLRSALRIGGLGAIAAWHLSLVGMVQTFSDRQLIGETITLGYVLLASVMLLVGYLAARRGDALDTTLLYGIAAASVIGLSLTILALLSQWKGLNLRSMFNFASPRLVKILTFESEAGLALLFPVIGGAICGLLAGALALIPSHWRRVIIKALVITILFGLLGGVLRPILSKVLSSSTRSFLFTFDGLTIAGALIVLALTTAIIGVTTTYGLPGVTSDESGKQVQKKWSYIYLGLLGVFLLGFPQVADAFLANTANLIGLYLIMGLGLNLVIGFAGMLDLGFVAFFAIGAYTMGVLTSPEIGSFQLSFWQVLPLAMLLDILGGVILGLPVLRMRGDYLAIATLGFGEIIRLLVISDELKPVVGGAQGITRITRPHIGSLTIETPQHFFYLVVIGILVAWFIALRLKNSRIGRAWMAIREDEDVAQAMGINRVTAKLLAFSIGAFLGGLSGAIFASLLTSVVPKSFELLVSINVLALLIVGGMGSLPGAVVGAIVLVGLPELLREFAEYRMLVYGVVLVLMMRYKPEGLWPEARRKAELHEAKEAAVTEEIPAAVPSE